MNLVEFSKTVNKSFLIIFVAGGFLGVVVSLIFRDKVGLLISSLTLFGGAILYGVQYFAWVQWQKKEEEKEKKEKENCPLL